MQNLVADSQGIKEVTDQLKEALPHFKNIMKKIDHGDGTLRRTDQRSEPPHDNYCKSSAATRATNS